MRAVKRFWGWLGVVDDVLGRLKILFWGVMAVGGILLAVWASLRDSLGSAGAVVLVLGIALAITGIVGLLFFSHPGASVAAPTLAAPLVSEAEARAQKPSPEERIVVDVTPQYLMGFFKDHMAIQAKKLTEAYIGKWIRVSGPVGQVFPFNGYFSQVTFKHGYFSDFSEIFMYFSDEWVDRLSVLTRGDPITVLGRIERVESLELHLRPCELE